MRMAAFQVLRPLSTHQLFSTRSLFIHRFLSPIPTTSYQQQQHKLSNLDFQTRGLRLPQTSLPIEVQEENLSDAEPPAQKSRNEKKREARRAVKWGIELANFTTPQIKKILSVAFLDEEVFEALMLVKRLGPDVREGKRRQFNYIGRLLREVQPELMDTLIQASKDGDQSKIQELVGTGTPIVEAEEEGQESESDEEEEGCRNYINVASRWFDGLIIKDSDITNEVYSIHTVDFDRQELRKLVRKVHSIRSQQLSEENGDIVATGLVRAEKSLTCFLRSLAKQMPDE